MSGYEDRRGSKRSKRDDDENQMCRDFDKGTCFRGDRCKFRHPSEGEGNSTIPFCKDFRAGVCKFRDCVYVHGPPLLEEEYMKTGWVPRYVLKHCLDRFNLCIQYLKEDGVCTKGESCKYGHTALGLDLDKSDFDFSRECNHEMTTMAVCRTFGLCKEFIKDKCANSGGECKYKHSSPQDVGMGNNKSSWSDVSSREGVDGYVRSVRGGLLDGDMMNDGGMRGGNMGNMGNMMGGGMMGGGGGGEEMMMLRQENEMLRIEMENLRKQNEGMKATNQFLLEENASMRAKQMESKQGSSVKQESSFGGSGQGGFAGGSGQGGFGSGSGGFGGGGNRGFGGDGSTRGFGGGNTSGGGGYGGSGGAGAGGYSTGGSGNGGRGEYSNGGGFGTGGGGTGFGSFQGVSGGSGLSGREGRGSSGGGGW